MKVIPIRRPLVTKLAGLPDGRFVAGFDDGSLQIFDVHSGYWERVAWDETPPKGGVNDIAVLPSGRIAIGFGDDWLRLYDTTHAECNNMLAHDSSVNALAVLPDGVLACGTGSGMIYFYTSAGKCLGRLKAHDLGVLSLAALPDGCLASGSYEGQVHIWDPIESTCKGTIECGDALADVMTSRAVRCMSALPNGLLALGVNGYSKVLLCSIKGLKDVGNFYCHTGWVPAMQVLPDGRLAVATDLGPIELWNVKTGTSPEFLQGYQDQVRAMTILADGRLVSADDDTIRVWDL